jgi:hypothetical protein
MTRSAVTRTIARLSLALALPAWLGAVTGHLAPAARVGLHLAVYRLRAGDLATAVKRDGHGSNS